MVTVYTLQLCTSSITFLRIFYHFFTPWDRPLHLLTIYMDLGKRPPDAEVYKDHSDLSLKLIDFGFAKAFTEARPELLRDS